MIFRIELYQHHMQSGYFFLSQWRDTLSSAQYCTGLFTPYRVANPCHLAWAFSLRSFSSLFYPRFLLPVFPSQMPSQSAFFQSWVLFSSFHGFIFSRKFCYFLCTLIFLYFVLVSLIFIKVLYTLFSRSLIKKFDTDSSSSHPHGSQEILPTTSLHCRLFPVISLLQQLESHMEMAKTMWISFSAQTLWGATSYLY